MPNLLFICSKNKWRSPTAELLFKKSAIHNVRSAGTSNNARIRVSQNLLDWADVVFIMEKKHKEILKQRFVLNNKQLIVLLIEDHYRFGDPELIAILRIALKSFLEQSL